MEIVYSSKMNKQICDEKTIKRNYGQLYDNIQFTISILIGASCLADVPNIPPTRRHKLTGNYCNCWGLDLSKNWRMIIRPIDEKVTLDEVDSIQILDIVEYH